MKKTLTVNLNNIVFHIDDDAYEMLQTYLADVEKHLSEDERKEVMTDIEARIAELFTERLQRNKNVVNLEDVEEIINVLGKPSQYGDTDEEDNTTQQSHGERKRTRRFYRDQDKAILGGVAAGLAAYLSWDVTLVRIIFVILVFLGVGMVIPIYLLIWVIAPAAITAGQRLEMQGEDVTAESIKTEINNVKNYMESDKFKNSANRIGTRIGEVFRTVFKVLFGFIGGVLGFAGMIVAGVLIIVLLALIFDPVSVTGYVPGLVPELTTLSPEKVVLLIVALLLVVGCPLFMLVYGIVRMVNGRQHAPVNHTTSWIVLILWLAGLFMFYSVGARSILNWSRNNFGEMEWSWDSDDASKSDETRNVVRFNSIDVSGNIELVLSQDSVQQVTVNADKSVLSKVFTEVEDGTLKIYTRKLFLNHKVKVYIAVDSLKYVSASGACEVKTTDDFYSKDFFLELSGASRADMDIQVANKMNINVSGASVADINGNTVFVEGEASGASKIEADDLKSRFATGTASGASEIKLFATEKLSADATGASRIHCDGSPKEVSKESHAGSSVEVE